MTVFILQAGRAVAKKLQGRANRFEALSHIRRDGL
jgi:hypothetical protein